MDPMKPTRIPMLVALAVIAGALGWGVVQIVEAWAGRLVPVPWMAAAALWIFAAALAYWALTSRPRLQRRPGAKPMPALVAARTAALAMAASRIGALVAGFYAGVAIAMVPHTDTESGAQIIMAASAASIGAIALTAAALWLEHVCRLPIGPPDDPS